MDKIPGYDHQRSKIASGRQSITTTLEYYNKAQGRIAHNRSNTSLDKYDKSSNLTYSLEKNKQSIPKPKKLTKLPSLSTVVSKPYLTTSNTPILETSVEKQI